MFLLFKSKGDDPSKTKFLGQTNDTSFKNANNIASKAGIVSKKKIVTGNFGFTATGLDSNNEKKSVWTISKQQAKDLL